MNKPALALSFGLLAACPRHGEESLLSKPQPVSTYTYEVSRAIKGLDMPGVLAQVTECSPFQDGGIVNRDMAEKAITEQAQRRVQAAIFETVNQPIIVHGQVVKEEGQYAAPDWAYLNVLGETCLDYKTETYNEYPGSLCVTMTVMKDWFSCSPVIESQGL